MDHHRPSFRPTTKNKKHTPLMAKWRPDPPCGIFCPTRPQWPGGWINDMMGCWSPGSTKCMGVEIYLVGTWHLFCSYKSEVLTPVSTNHLFPPWISLRNTCSYPPQCKYKPLQNTSAKKKKQDSQLRRWEHELRRGLCDVNGTCKLQARFRKDICGRKEWRINS